MVPFALCPTRSLLLTTNNEGRVFLKNIIGKKEDLARPPVCVASLVQKTTIKKMMFLPESETVLGIDDNGFIWHVRLQTG